MAATYSPSVMQVSAFGASEWEEKNFMNEPCKKQKSPTKTSVSVGVGVSMFVFTLILKLTLTN
ncbi:MAG: hypothetical protein ACK54Y_04605 [Bacteroidota bacterium]